MTYFLNIFIFFCAVIDLLSGRYEAPYTCTPLTPSHVAWFAVLFGVPLIIDFGLAIKGRMS